jgi:hypothetical protein
VISGNPVMKGVDASRASREAVLGFNLVNHGLRQSFAIDIEGEGVLLSLRRAGVETE